jgi:hypothetical protein
LRVEVSLTEGATMSWSSVNKVGLVLLALVGASNLVPWPAPPDAQNGPPMGVLIAGAVLGVIAIIAVIHAWRKGNRRSAWVAIGASVINALLAVPAFFVDGVPSSIRNLVAVYIAVTVVAIALTLKPNSASA